MRVVQRKKRKMLSLFSRMTGSSPSPIFPDLPGTREGRTVYVAAFNARMVIAYVNASRAKKAHADAEAQLAAVALALEAAKRSSVASATELARDAIVRFYACVGPQLFANGAASA